MEGKPPLALWFSHTGIIAYPPHRIQYFFSTPNTPLYSEIPFFDPKKSYIDIKNNLPYTTQGNGILYISGQAKTERLTALEVVIDDIRFRTSTCTTSGNINLPSMTSFMMPVSAGCTIQINGRFDFCEFREAFFYQLSEVR